MLIDVELLATIGIILPPAPSVVQGGSSDASVYTRASVRRASGFVLTGKPDVIPADPDQRHYFRLADYSPIDRSDT